jgi:hypothetical protein
MSKLFLTLNTRKWFLTRVNSHEKFEEKVENLITNLGLDKLEICKFTDNKA